MCSFPAFISRESNETGRGEGGHLFLIHKILRWARFSERHNNY
jgi:hypothetical protein